MADLTYFMLGFALDSVEGAYRAGMDYLNQQFAEAQQEHEEWPRFNSSAIRIDAIRYKMGSDLRPIPQDHHFDRFRAGIDIYSLRHTLQLAGGKVPADLAVRCFVARTS